MDDQQIVQRITDIADEEARLRTQPAHALTAEERASMEEMEVALDQCWDLLRQRRARREFGQDPEDAQVRDAGTVEGYQG